MSMSICPGCQREYPSNDERSALETFTHAYITASAQEDGISVHPATIERAARQLADHLREGVEGFMLDLDLLALDAWIPTKG